MEIVLGIIKSRGNEVMVVIENTTENIANFIGRCPASGRLTITDEAGKTILTTFGNFLDRISDMDFRMELLEYLIPIQTNEVQPKDVKFINYLDDEMSEDDFVKEVYEDTGYKLKGDIY